MLLITGLTSILALFCVVLPIKRYYREEQIKNFDRKLKLYKTWAIRNYYPELSTVPLEEIEQRYDVNSAYQNMGKRFLHHR